MMCSERGEAYLSFGASCLLAPLQLILEHVEIWLFPKDLGLTNLRITQPNNDDLEHLFHTCCVIKSSFNDDLISDHVWKKRRTSFE